MITFPSLVQPGIEIDFDDPTHTYTVNGEWWPHVTQILADQKCSPSFEFVPVAALEAARDRGQDIHLACQLLDEDDLDWGSLPGDQVPYVQGWDQFKEDTGFHVELIESLVACQSYRYVGRLDRKGLLRDGSHAIVDLKSGLPQAAASLQMAAYGYALDPTQVFHRFVVRLQPNGKPVVKEAPVDTYIRDVNVFLAATSVFNWRLENRVKAA
jgi:hypothetical protein